MIHKYPDGTSYVNVENIGPEDEIVFKINTYEDLWHLNQYVDAFNNYHKSKPSVVIPNLIDAQADRRFSGDHSSGLKLVCEFLNNMNAEFVVFHPHNPEVVEALMNNVRIVDNSSFISEVILSIIKSQRHTFQSGIQVEEYLNNKLTLMSSDAGGFKPLMKLCDKLKFRGIHYRAKTYSASKSRTYYDGESRLNQIIDRENFHGNDILIVDDICVYGGTFKGLSEILRERNCGKLYLAVSHITVQDLGDDPVTNYFDKVFTTNSKYDKYFGKVFNESISGDCVNAILENLEVVKEF